LFGNKIPISVWQIKTVATDGFVPAPKGEHSEKRRVSFALEEEMWNGGSDSESEEEDGVEDEVDQSISRCVLATIPRYPIFFSSLLLSSLELSETQVYEP